MSLPFTPAGSPAGRALEAEAFGHELLLGRRVVHEQHVSVAAAADVQRLSSPDRDRPDDDSSRFRECREQMGEQAGLLGGSRGSHHDAAVLRESGRQCGKTHAGKKSRQVTPAEERHHCDLLEKG
jgi:hypothetical protein